MTYWRLSHRADQRSRQIADRHYNRQKIGSPQFVPPGRCMVLRAGDEALWVTSFPFAQYVKHAWAGAWVNSCFRNESDLLASDLIREAVAITLSYTMVTESWGGEIPELGMITFVDARKVRHQGRNRNPGFVYEKAGFRHVGHTKAGLWAYQLLPAEMPSPIAVPPDDLGSPTC